MPRTIFKSTNQESLQHLRTLISLKIINKNKDLRLVIALEILRIYLKRREITLKQIRMENRRRNEEDSYFREIFADNRATMAHRRPIYLEIDQTTQSYVCDDIEPS